MPPQGSPPQSKAGPNITGTGGEPYYSNEDVAILHDIVVLAQELLPKLPERERLPTNALFSAYYDILPRIGINSDHDSRYARILFKIGGLRGQGTLYEKFEEILSRMGIEIEFDHQEDEEQYSQIEESQYSLEIAATDEPLPQDENEDPRRHRRRNSESSAWDGGNQLRALSKNRRNSVSSAPKVDDQSTNNQHILQDELPPEQLPLRAANLQNQKEEGSEHIVGTWLRTRPDKPRRGRNRSISTHGSLRIRRRSPSATRRRHPAKHPSIPASDDFQAPSEVTAVTSAFGEDATSDLASLVQRPLSRQDAHGLLEIRSSMILQHRLSFAARQHLRHWRGKLHLIRADNVAREAVAERHDRKALLQSALDSWRLLSLQKRQVAETERFFAHLGRRAARARDLYLMHVAFTHWLVHANEQAQRTALARRHIVRTRIFNAWRDITAVNELKVRRQVLKKFFSLWRQKSSVASADADFAIQKYEGNLVKNIYKQWLRKLWDVKATAWWAEGVKRNTLFRWILVSHRSWEVHRTAEEERQLQLIWHAWKTWRSKTETQIRQKQQAEQHRLDRLRLTPLRKWRHETQMVPAKTTVQSDVSVRLLRETFRIWLHRTRLERRAAAMDRMKILQEALTNWQYRSRSRLVRTLVENNLKSKSIYRWLVAQRCSHRRREEDQETFVQCFRRWIQVMRAVRAQRQQQEAVTQSFMIQRTQDIAFRHWYSRTHSIRQLEATAIDFATPRAQSNAVAKWSARTRHLERLQGWSRDAKFYILATKTMKQWRAATETAKREKRKAAYAQVRRMSKINLARGTLRTWLEKARHTLDLEARAREMGQNRNVVIAMEIFDRWRGRAEELADLESVWRGNVLKKQFTVWRDQSQALLALNTGAILRYQEHRQSRTVKKWSLLSLQVRAQSNYAADICEKNAKRTFRKMFTYWRQKAAHQRPLQKPHTGLVSGHLGNTARAEAWSDFGEDLEIDESTNGVDGAAVSAPIPGYLSTPSKKSERVMAGAAKFSTTPKAALSTPFERHLRAQYSGGLLPALRKSRGKSTLSMGEGFEDIAGSTAKRDLAEGGQ